MWESRADPLIRKSKIKGLLLKDDFPDYPHPSDKTLSQSNF